MSTVALPLGIVILALALLVELALLDRWCRGDRRTWARGRRRPAAVVHPVEPARRPLELVAADLRRLSRQLTLVPAGAPLVRWRALWAAYDAVLTEAADSLEVPHALPTTPVGLGRDIERLRVLAALEGAGLVVHG